MHPAIIHARFVAHQLERVKYAFCRPFVKCKFHGVIVSEESSLKLTRSLKHRSFWKGKVRQRRNCWRLTNYSGRLTNQNLIPTKFADCGVITECKRCHWVILLRSIPLLLYQMSITGKSALVTMEGFDSEILSVLVKLGSRCVVQVTRNFQSTTVNCEYRKVMTVVWRKTRNGQSVMRVARNLICPRFETVHSEIK